MEWVSPLGPVYQAGTLAGNPVAVSAGIATLHYLKSRSPYKALDQLTGWFTEEDRRDGTGNRPHGASQPRRVHVDALFQQCPGRGSFERPTFERAPLRHVLPSPPRTRGLFSAVGRMKSAFLTTAHTKAILKKALAAIEKTFKKLPLS